MSVAPPVAARGLCIGEALAEAGVAPGEARRLLADASGLAEAELIAHPERRLPAPVAAAYRAALSRRRGGEPMAYIRGRCGFHDLELEVGPGVLIPRPETELLVDLAIARAPATVLDLGTGSGAIALAVKRQLPQARVAAVDASAAALAVARRNARRLGLEVVFHRGDWFAPVAGVRFDLVLSNPPYVADADPHLAMLGFEPRQALVSGADGLAALRAIVAGARAHLVPGGWLLLEHGLGQAQAVRALLERAGFGAVTGWPDVAGIARVAGGQVKS